MCSRRIRRAITILGRLPGRKELGKDLDEQGTDHGQTGAHDGDVGLDDGPHCGVEVEGQVLCPSGHVDGGSAQAGSDNDEASEGEDEDEGDLLDDGDLELVDEGHGDQEYDNVGGDGEAGVGPPELVVVDALAFQGQVVGLLDGRALEDGGDDGGRAEGGDDADEDPAGVLEPPDLVEDAEVQQQDGALAEVDG